MKELNYKILDNIINILNYPILIYFWSEWCQVCKVSRNIIQDIKLKFKNKIKIIKINIDYNYYTTEKFSIKNIPTIIVILKKKIIIKKQGLFDKEFLKKIIKKIL